MSDEPAQLMDTLVTKMESMDKDIQILMSENLQMRKMIDNPSHLMKRAGFVPTRTPFAEDLQIDPFRGDELLKGEANPSADLDAFSNEDIHDMSWEQIHEMADQHKEVKELY